MNIDIELKRFIKQAEYEKNPDKLHEVVLELTKEIDSLVSDIAGKNLEITTLKGIIRSREQTINTLEADKAIMQNKLATCEGQKRKRNLLIKQLRNEKKCYCRDCNYQKVNDIYSTKPCLE